MNLFATLKRYAEQFKPVAARDFTPEELSMVKSAKVVPSQYGFSVCFYMKEGCQTYVPVSRDSSVTAGDEVDLTKAKVLILERDGEQIKRIEI